MVLVPPLVPNLVLVLDQRRVCASALEKPRGLPRLNHCSCHYNCLTNTTSLCPKILQIALPHSRPSIVETARATYLRAATSAAESVSGRNPEGAAKVKLPTIGVNSTTRTRKRVFATELRYDTTSH